jgi:hypothetical protein
MPVSEAMKRSMITAIVAVIAALGYIALLDQDQADVFGSEAPKQAEPALSTFIESGGLAPDGETTALAQSAAMTPAARF